MKTNYFHKAILALCFFFFSLESFSQVLISDTGVGPNLFEVYYPANFAGYVTNGITITFKSNQTITGPAQIKLNGMPAVDIKKLGTLQLVANDIVTDQFVTITFNAGAFQMTSLAGASVSSSDWSILGNANTVDGTNFIGTTNDIPFNIRVNNIMAGRIESDTWVGNNSANTFLGYKSGSSNTTGGYNTALGSSALFSNSTGPNNIAIGYEALFRNTDGSDNCALGVDALYDNTSGYSNCAFGKSALAQNTTGIENNAFGLQSLMQNNTGDANTANGYFSLLWNTTGSNNTAVGYHSGKDNTTGANNTFIGNAASLFNSASQHNNATAIGANAKVDADNAMVLGDNSINVGIGTSIPDASSILDLTSTARGLLIPRMTTIQMLAIPSPATGLIVFQTDGTKGFYYFDGTSWVSTSGGSGWELTGNPSTVDGTHFIGTTNDIPFNIKVNGVKAGRIESDTYVGNNFENTFFGYQSGSSITTGFANTAIGSKALLFNSTGPGNTAIGYHSLYTNSSGVGNTASGSWSLLTNLGDNNSAYGVQSLHDNTTGTENTAIGDQAGWNNATGSYNTFIGSTADLVGTQHDRAIAIGWMAKVDADNAMVLGGTGADAVNVGIGTSIPDPSSILDMVSTDKGLLIPRLSTIQRTTGIAIPGPANGLIVYDIDLNLLFYNAGTAIIPNWVSLANGGTAWDLTGNTGTTAGTDFVGTIDAVDLVLKTDNLERMRITSSGDIGIACTPNPLYKLDVNGGFHSNGVTESSDIRWKKNINTIDNALSKTLQLRGVMFDWRKDEFKDKNFPDKNQMGLIAQEVELVIPQAVNTDTKGFKSVEYSKLVALLIEAIKEQEKKINNLEKENASLKLNNDGQVNLLKAELKSLTNRLDAIDGGDKITKGK